MRDLNGRGKQRDLDFAGGQTSRGVPQRLGILRQVPLINAHGIDIRAEAAQRLHQFDVRATILLHRDVLLGTTLDRGHELAPGVRLGHRYGYRNLHFA